MRCTSPTGDPNGFKRFVDAAHARGIGVLLDVVYNHFGPTGNHLDRFGPYTTDRHRTPWGDAVNLDGPDSGPVRRFFLDNARHWLRNYHLDGLRLDAVHALVDESASTTSSPSLPKRSTRSRPPCIDRSRWLRSTRRPSPPQSPAATRAGTVSTAEWRDEVHHALHAAITGERRRLLRRVRIAGRHRDLRSPDRRTTLPRHRFVACTQNHDQIGNRARGERLVHLAGIENAKIAAGLLLCGPFTPLLFMGEEWAASTPFPYFCEHA